jgi:hypothetical protein
LALTFSPNAAPAGTLVGADYIVFSDTNDSNLAKKGLVSDITALAAVDVSSATLLIAGQVFS